MTETVDVRELARSLYLKHRAAVELIYRNRPDYVSEAKEIFRSGIAGQPNWTLDVEEPQVILFRSVEWDCFEVFKTGTGWRSGSLVTLGFDFRPGHPNLIVTLGPGTDEAARRRIHAGISQHPKLFSQVGSRLETSYTRLDVKGPITTDADYDNWDEPAVRDKLTGWIAAFADGEFLRMNKVIVECLREYKAG